MRTIKEIAKRAGVSVGTVSNYLNTPDKVAEKSSEAIRKAIEDVGYHPRAAARSLKSNHTHRIGLVPIISLEDNLSLEPSDNAFLEFLAAVNAAAAENGYGVLLHAATSPGQVLPIYKSLVGEREVDGILLMGTQPIDVRVNYLNDQKFPFVSFGRTENSQKHAFVDVDGALGLADAVDHLVKLGHQLIGYITPPDGLMCARYRWEGFSKAMALHNLTIREDLVVKGDFTEKSGQLAMHFLLDLPQPPTAVITSNDLCAFGAMRALSMRGLIPGKDVSVIGFDDIRQASHWHPSLTTVAQPLRRLGFIATQMLINIIDGKQVEEQIVLKPQLIIRQSTGPVE
jgi:LacI family transcriptional regulator